MKAAIAPCGDSALTVTFEAPDFTRANPCVLALRDALAASALPGLRELVPGFAALQVYYDPRVLSYGALRRRLRGMLRALRPAAAESGRLLEIPCLYDGEDINDLAAWAKLSREEVIRLHSAPEYRVYMLGFLPGFVYLGGLDERICMPRLETPRRAVPAGSVGIAGVQTGVYPMQSPGGWRLIGRTPLRFYDPGRAEPALCRAGDRLRFVPIDAATYERLAAEEAAK